ncbi:hypothetical protein NCLIV_019900 [Neospora caninum Liverpool]|uniref:Uncharacterized protein n=1 Tax=Neospora caninum (strain Liverpool) TaxID=572307 RepID=F0VEQ7_NEOCL|nr:hypothetical protein NCLIV_019900 [Neospora caninum Liverpool]CBZ52201.1 hypothetical protein NCLIV_019900 [Neospora caninum Liverpool]|eukprot:XP_003882233.1 hypothetical protein NCLIV_019900 [Neospora caninum Liverpool]
MEAVCSVHQSLAEAPAVLVAKKKLRRSLSTAWRRLDVSPRSAERIERILASHVSSSTLAVRQKAAGEGGGPEDLKERVNRVAKETLLELKQVNLVQVLSDAIAADPSLIQPPTGGVVPGSLISFLQGYHEDPCSIMSCFPIMVDGQVDRTQAEKTTDDVSATQQSKKPVASPKGQSPPGRRKRGQPVREEGEEEVEQPGFVDTDDGGFSTGGASGLESAFASDGEPGHAAEVTSVHGSTGSEHTLPSPLLDISVWGEQGVGKKEGESPQGYSDDTANADASVADHAAVSGLSSGSLVLYPESELGPPPPKKARSETHKQEGGKGIPASPSHGEDDTPAGAEEETSDVEGDLGFPEDWIFQPFMDLGGDDGDAPPDVWAEPQTGLPYAPLPQGDPILDNLVSLLDAQEYEDGMAEGDDDSQGQAE